MVGWSGRYPGGYVGGAFGGGGGMGGKAITLCTQRMEFEPWDA
jgi:hypothetical protein